MSKTRKKVVIIGGGTGTYTALTGLKKYPIDLTAVVTMMDSGGSNRVLRDEFGLLPTSDIRQCIVALASDLSDKDLRKLFIHRYSDIYGSQEKAIEKTCEMLDVQGDIVPVTFDNSNLVARYDNGEQVLGEHFIDEPREGMGNGKIVELELIPNAKANKKAIKKIKEADLIVLGPGDLFTSVICNFLVEGIAKAIKNSKAKKVYVINLMTKFGETTNFKASDYLSEIEKYLKVMPDACLINKSNNISPSLVKRYKEEKAVIVKDDLVKENYPKTKIVRRSLISNKTYKKKKSDTIKRSLIRHDSTKLARAIVSLLK